MTLCAGFKTFSDPNFDFNSTCLTFVTCLQEIKNWFLDTAGFDTLPITIYVEPRDSTFLTANTAINADFAKSNVGGPGECASSHHAMFAGCRVGHLIAATRPSWLPEKSRGAMPC